MIRVVSVALPVVGMLAGSASAECAWVVWSTQRTDLSSPYETHHIERAHPTRRECLEDVQVCAELLKKEGYTMRAQGGPEAIGERATGRERIRYFCLPDTVDPRGPKGK
jgi:hypothetical protein